jgi:hypothetical protein
MRNRGVSTSFMALRFVIGVLNSMRRGRSSFVAAPRLDPAELSRPKRLHSGGCCSIHMADRGLVEYCRPPATPAKLESQRFGHGPARRPGRLEVGLAKDRARVTILGQEWLGHDRKTADRKMNNVAGIFLSSIFLSTLRLWVGAGPRLPEASPARVRHAALGRGRSL